VLQLEKSAGFVSVILLKGLTAFMAERTEMCSCLVVNSNCPLLCTVYRRAAFLILALAAETQGRAMQTLES
jgi:hypothetical protein